MLLTGLELRVSWSSTLARSSRSCRIASRNERSSFALGQLGSEARFGFGLSIVVTASGTNLSAHGVAYSVDHVAEDDTIGPGDDGVVAYDPALPETIACDGFEAPLVLMHG